MKFYVYGKFDERRSLEPIKSFESKIQAEFFASVARERLIQFNSNPWLIYKFDNIRVTKYRSKNWEDNIVTFLKKD